MQTSNLATVKGNLGHLDEALALAQREGVNVGGTSGFASLVPAKEIEASASKQYKTLLAEAANRGPGARTGTDAPPGPSPGRAGRNARCRSAGRPATGQYHQSADQHSGLAPLPAAFGAGERYLSAPDTVCLTPRIAGPETR